MVKKLQMEGGKWQTTIQVFDYVLFKIKCKIFYFSAGTYTVVAAYFEPQKSQKGTKDQLLCPFVTFVVLYWDIASPYFLF